VGGWASKDLKFNDLKIGGKGRVRGQILCLRHIFTTNYHPYARSPEGEQILNPGLAIGYLILEFTQALCNISVSIPEFLSASRKGTWSVWEEKTEIEPRGAWSRFEENIPRDWRGKPRRLRTT